MGKSASPKANNLYIKKNTILTNNHNKKEQFLCMMWLKYVKTDVPDVRHFILTQHILMDQEKYIFNVSKIFNSS